MATNKISIAGVEQKLETSATWNTDRDTIMKTYDTSDLWIKTLWANGIYRRSDMSLFDAFHKFPRLDPYNAVNTTREYVFFVKPDLHIFDGDASVLNPEISKMPFFYDLMDRGYNHTVLKQLQYGVDPTHPFINILTNRKTSNLDLPGVQAEDVESNANYYGTKIRYRRGTEKSDEECDFSIEFEDTKYLEIYLLFKAYDEYEKKKWNGKVTPPSVEYTLNHVLHDQMGVYKFVVGEDGETILHWSQFWGVYPVSLPRDAFSEVSNDGHLKLTIQWRASFVDDMQPNTLSDFNYLSNNYIPSPSGNIPMWDQNISAVDGRNVYRPYIVKSKVANANGYKDYRLLWGA